MMWSSPEPVGALAWTAPCFETELTGRHGVLNILAGIAVARVFGIAAAIWWTPWPA